MCSVRGVLGNPKYTGYMVWNRRARKSKTGKVNSREQWVTSTEPTHPALVSVETFVLAGQVSAWRFGSRSGDGSNEAHPDTRRSYLLRSFAFCAQCGYRMHGKTRDRTYYACVPPTPARGNQHTGSLWVREDGLIRGLGEFFDTCLFGVDRRAQATSRLADANEQQEAARLGRRTELEATLRDLDCRQQRLLASLETLDQPDGHLIRQLQRRHAELRVQHQTATQALKDLESYEQQETNVDLLEALPIGHLDMAAPEVQLRRLFELTRLEIHYDKRHHFARYKVTLHAETMTSLCQLLVKAAPLLVPLKSRNTKGHDAEDSPVPVAGLADGAKLNGQLPIEITIGLS